MIKKIKSLLNNEIFSKGLIALLFKILGGIFGYVFLLLVTRTAGAEIWGVFSLCLALISISSIFSVMGIDISLVKFIATFKSQLSNIKDLYIRSVKIISISSIFISIMLFFLSDLIANNIFNKSFLAEYFKITSCFILPFSIISVNAQTLRGMKKIMEFALFKHMLRFLFPIICFLLIVNYTDYSVRIAPIFAFLFSIFFLFLLSTIYTNKIVFTREKVKRKIKTNKLISSSIPMMISASIILTMSWADTLMIGIFLPGTDQVGIYNGGLRLAMITSVILESINSIVAPKISESYNNGNLKVFKQVVRYSTKLIFLSTFPVFCLLFFFPEFILSFLGDEFISAKYVLMILLLAKLIDSISGSVGVILQMTGCQKIFQNIVFVALIVNIILNMFLIPKFGIEGAAISSACSIILWNISAVIYVYRKFGVWSFFNFKK